MDKSSVSFKRKIGRPKVGATLVGVSFPPELLSILDLWITQQNDAKLGRPEAVRRLLQERLKPKA